MVEKYNILIRLVHWAMAIVIIGLLIAGIYMHDLPRNDELRPLLYSLHKSFGVMALGLLAMRILLRLLTKAPPLPKSFSKANIALAHTGHAILYVLMALIPISGYVMSNSYGYGVKFFGYALPNIVDKDKEMGGLSGEIHEIAAYIIIAFLVLHVIAVIKHRFFDKKENDILKRML